MDTLFCMFLVVIHNKRSFQYRKFLGPYRIEAKLIRRSSAVVKELRSFQAVFIDSIDTSSNVNKLNYVH